MIIIRIFIRPDSFCRGKYLQNFRRNTGNKNATSLVNSLVDWMTDVLPTTLCCKEYDSFYRPVRGLLFCPEKFKVIYIHLFRFIFFFKTRNTFKMVKQGGFFATIF